MIDDRIGRGSQRAGERVRRAPHAPPASVLVLGVLAAWLAFPGRGVCAGTAPRTLANLQDVILRAKQRVYPALVHVRPIREEFTRGEKRRLVVIGSGVIISPDGLVVTNSHVAEKAVEIRCVLADKTQVSAKVMGLDPDTDLALLQLQRPAGAPALRFAEFADSDKAEEGDFVLALGSPYGFSRSISQGILSHTRRYIDHRGKHLYSLWIQTDAAINPGNSGGPLVDIDGKVVGITTRKLRSGGLAFAIPSNTVTRVVAKLKRDGKVVRAWTGIQLQPLRDFSRNTFLEDDKGVLVASIDDGSPAQEASLATGDLLLAVNGREFNALYLEDLPRARRRLADLPPGQPAELRIRRANGLKVLTITPRLKEAAENGSFYAERWDMTVKAISKFESKSLYYFAKEGVYVVGVKRNGAAYKAQVRPNDVIVSIDRTPVKTLADVRRVYAGLFKDRAPERKTLFELMRGGYKRWAVVVANRPKESEQKPGKEEPQ